MAFWDQISRTSLTTYNVQDYGAKSFSSLGDSSPAVRSAIADAVSKGGGAIYFPALRDGSYYNLDKDPTKIASINIEDISVPLVFLGDGSASRLVYSGQGNGGAWSMFRIRNSRNIKFLNLHMEMGLIVNPDPNTGADPHHLIHMDNNGEPGGSLENIEIAGCTFRFCRGDQVKLICEVNDDGFQTRGVWIHHCWFDGTSTFGFLDANDDPVGCRSCVQVQRNCYDVWLTDCRMTGCAKAMIDFEPTGTGGVGRFKIERNILINAPPNGTDGSSSVSLSGNGATEPNQYSTFSHNILLNGGIQSRMLECCEFVGNIILDNRIHSNPTFNLSGKVRYVRIADNYMHRFATGSNDLEVINLAYASGDVVSEVRVENNDLVQEKYRTPLLIEGFTGTALVRGNRIYYNGPNYDAEDGNVFHLLMRSQGQTPVGQVDVSGNHCLGTGLTRACIQVSADLGDLGDVAIHSNHLKQAATGVEFNRGTTFTIASVSLQGNRCGSGMTSWSSVGGQTIHPVIAGNLGGVCTFETGASPEGVLAAPVGSMALNRAGSTSTTLYVKTSGTGNTGWTAK